MRAVRLVRAALCAERWQVLVTRALGCRHQRRELRCRVHWAFSTAKEKAQPQPYRIFSAAEAKQLGVTWPNPDRTRGFVDKVYPPRRTWDGWEWLPNPDYDGPPEEPDEPESGWRDEFGDFDEFGDYDEFGDSYDERAFERRFEAAAHDSFLAEFWAERAGCG